MAGLRVGVSGAGWLLCLVAVLHPTHSPHCPNSQVAEMTPFFNAFAIEDHTGMSIETMQDYRDIAINAVSSYTASILTRQGMVADGTAYECPICFEDDMIPGNLCTECNQSCCVVCENKWNASCPFCRHATWCVLPISWLGGGSEAR